LVLLYFLLALGGCKEGFQDLSKSLRRDDAPSIVIPPYIQGTVAEFAGFAGGGRVPVQAHGIVVGLGNNGSSEVPAHLRGPLTQYLLRHHIGSYRMGTSALSPDRVLQDKDTSVVLVGGSVPLGAPVGTRFDVFVTSLPQTQTRSLDGGVLMPIEMRLAFGGLSRADKLTQIWAKTGGAVFVNPFVDPSRSQDMAKLRAGRIIGGGRVTRLQPLRLQLRQGDYAMADLIQRKINERFGGEEKIAKALNRFVIELTIPRDYRDDYTHFLELVMHLPIRTSSDGWEARTRQIAEQMEKPQANHRELALVWEAMGRQVVPILRTLYDSTHAAAAYYAACTGLRLRDAQAEEVILYYAASSHSLFKISAIEELGRHRWVIRARSVLQRLLDNPNESVRIAAYEALRKRGDRSVVSCGSVDGKFDLDLVTSSRDYTIYATQTHRPKIVLFGRDMIVQRPIFFEAPDELVTVSAISDTSDITVFRKVPLSGAMSDPFPVAPAVHSLVKTLGTVPELDEAGQVTGGLGLTYSQVVAVLYRMCKQGDIPARFVLQPAEPLQKIYQSAATVGRPDMPEP